MIWRICSCILLFSAYLEYAQAKKQFLTSDVSMSFGGSNSAEKANWETTASESEEVVTSPPVPVRKSASRQHRRIKVYEPVTPVSTSEDDYLKRFPSTAWSHSSEDDNDNRQRTPAVEATTEKSSNKEKYPRRRANLREVGDKIARLDEFEQRQQIALAKYRSQRKSQAENYRKYLAESRRSEDEGSEVAEDDLPETTTEAVTTTTKKRKLRQKKRKRIIRRPKATKTVKKSHEHFDQESFLGGWKEEDNGIAQHVRKLESIDSPMISIPADQALNETYTKAYYEAYYKEWYRINNHAQPGQTMEPKKISIQLGKANPEQAAKYLTENFSTPPPALNPLAFLDPMRAGEVEPTRQQLDTICHSIRAVSRSFGIKDPISFAKNNCAFVKLYYPRVTCLQIEHTMEYCTPILTS